jgi:gamma-glutamyl-gamma-aminobutyrate hydrolase PuuD
VLIVTGGDDHPVRNQVEHELVDVMTTRNVPVIGICHGCQFLTQKLGGTVMPVHDHQDSYHEVFYQDESHLVNSYHTLRIAKLPPGATVLANDPDGNIEAWIHGRTAALMWHPERMKKPWIPNEIKELFN